MLDSFDAEKVLGRVTIDGRKTLKIQSSNESNQLGKDSEIDIIMLKNNYNKVVIKDLGDISTMSAF